MSQGFYGNFEMRAGTIAVLCAGEDCMYFNDEAQQFETDLDSMVKKITQSGTAHITQM